VTALWNLEDDGVLYSTVLTRVDVDFLYCPITRCASTWITHRLVEINNFYTMVKNIKNDNIPFEEYSHKTKLFIVRDPLERIVSGAKTREDFTVEDFSLDAPVLFEKLKQDVHTLPMYSWFHSFIDLSNAVYIRYGNWDRLDKFFGRFNILPNEVSSELRPWSPTMEWREGEDGTSRNSAVWLEYVLGEPDILDKLNEYLKDDYKFLKTVKYYE